MTLHGSTEQVGRTGPPPGGPGWYRRLVENVREGVAYLSPEHGIVTYCNRAYASILGLTPENLAGRSFLDFLDEPRREEGVQQNGLRPEGFGSIYELAATASDGTEKLLSCCAYPQFDENGLHVGTVHTMMDVTEQRRTEAALTKSEERFVATFEAAAVGMAYLSLEGTWLSINGKLCEIFGYPRRELLSLALPDLSPPEEAQKIADAVRGALDGKAEPQTVETRIVRKDGSRAWVSLRISLARDALGEPDCLAYVADDVTERKLATLLREPLTSREMEVLRRVVRWQTNQEIAGSLAFSVSTIKGHVHEILHKLGVHSRREAAATAVEIGLIPPPR